MRRTCSLRAFVVSAAISFLLIADAAQKDRDKWHLIANSESEITNNYVSGTSSLAKDSSAVVSYNQRVQDLRKNKFQELQATIQKQLPKEAKFFDEFEGSECDLEISCLADYLTVCLN